MHALMKTTRILHVLFRDVRAEILRCLFIDPTRESYGRELARDTTLALRTVQQELDTLREAGLLTDRSDGFRRLYRANRKHFLFADLQQLAIKGNKTSTPFVSQHKRPRRSRRQL
jgi:DNA-binding transcriptional ArsR family regulator